MSCPDEKLLKLFASGRLEQEQEDWLEHHLETCPNCAKRLGEIENASHDPLVSDLKAIDNRIDSSSFSGSNDSVSHESAAMPASIGNYQIVGVLGRGGMGIVYRGINPHLNRNVAIKVVKTSRIAQQSSVDRFYREMSAIGKLQHPNIVQGLDAGVIDGQPYLVMELLDGDDLAHYVQKNGPFSVHDACEIVRQVALGLQHAHNAGIIHRDIKPSNLWRMSDGTIKILDLGLARLQTETGATESGTGLYPTHGETLEGHILGSPDYMSPEQAVDPKLVDQRSDIYSLGCTFYYLLTGTPPYCGPMYSTLHEKIQGHSSEPFPSLSNIPKEIDTLLRQMASKTLSDRPDSLVRVIEILEKRSRIFPLRRFYHFAITALFLLCGIVAGTYFLGNSPSTTTGIQQNPHSVIVDKTDSDASPELSGHLEVTENTDNASEEVPVKSSDARRGFGDDFAAPRNIISNDTILVAEAKPPLHRRSQEKSKTTQEEIAADDGWKILRKIKTGTGANNSAYFCPDNKNVIEGSDDGITRLWNVETGEITREIKGPKSPVTALTLSWDYSKIAVAYEDATVSVRNFPDMKELFTYKSGGKCTVYEERIEKVNQKKSVAHRRTVETHDFTVHSTCLAFSCDGKKLFTLGTFPNLIDLETRHLLRAHMFVDRELYKKEYFTETIPDACVFFRSDFVLVIGMQSCIGLRIDPMWNTLKKDETSFVRFDPILLEGYEKDDTSFTSAGIKYNDDREILGIATGASGLMLYTRDLKKQPEDHEDLVLLDEKNISFFSEDAIVFCTAFSPNRKHMLIGGSKSPVGMWNLDSNRVDRIFPVENQDDLVLALDFSPDGKRFLVRTKEDKTITIWQHDGEVGEIIPRKSADAIRKSELPYVDKGPGKIKDITEQLDDGTYLETHKARYYEDGSYDIIEESYINDDPPAKKEAQKTSR